MKIKKLTYIWIAVSVVSLVVAYICSRMFLYADHYRYGNYLILLVALALLAWKAFMKGGKDESEKLRQTIKDLDRELAEKSRSRINVVELNPILHIAVMDVNTSFVRPYVREDGDITFNGALRADLQVEYGIRLEEVRFRYDSAANSLTLANFHPGIISYSRKQLKWEFAKSYRKRSFLGKGLSDVSDRESDEYTARMCETLRAGLEEEIDTRKVAEFEWLSPLITDQVVDMLKLMVGRDSLTVTIADGEGEDFVGLQEFRQQTDVAQIENQ